MWTSWWLTWSGCAPPCTAIRRARPFATRFSRPVRLAILPSIVFTLLDMSSLSAMGPAVLRFHATSRNSAKSRGSTEGGETARLSQIPEHLEQVTDLYVLLSQKEHLQAELAQLNRESAGLVSDGNGDLSDAALLKSRDFRQYYAWIVLTLDKLNDKVAEVLHSIKEAQVGLDMSPSRMDGDVTSSVESTTPASRWYYELIDECSREAAFHVKEAQPLVKGDSSEEASAHTAKALKLLAVIEKGVSRGFDDAEFRLALDSALTSLRPEQQENMPAFRALVAQGRRLQELHAASKAAAASEKKQ